MVPIPPRSPLFPHTTLFRSLGCGRLDSPHCREPTPALDRHRDAHPTAASPPACRSLPPNPHRPLGSKSSCRDRKSTRLNSSHLVISYALFSLKKKHTVSLNV